VSILWKIGGGLLLAAALFVLVKLYGGSQYRAGETAGTSTERTLWQAKVLQAEREKLIAYQAGVRSVQQADARYIETVRERVVPLTRTIVERSIAYEQTPAGAALCLAPDRVRWLEETRSALFATPAPAAAGRAGDALPSDGMDDEPGRIAE
jgi:hypothetical protein